MVIVTNDVEMHLKLFSIQSENNYGFREELKRRRMSRGSLHYLNP